MKTTSDLLLEINGLSIEFPMYNGTIHAVNNVDYGVRRGAISALVGESGSGKSTLAGATINMISSPGRITSGKIIYEGKDVLKMDKRSIRRYRWEEVSMVFQAAQNTLNPLMTIREQMIETIRVHSDNFSETEAMKTISHLLDYVRLDEERMLKCYPHELSGGMKQRIMIAFALMLNPKLMILDEPSTALDVITQRYIFDILTDIYKETHLTMLLLTHDIAIVANFADWVSVMYAGNIVESGDVLAIFKNPQHEYTKQLINDTPSLLSNEAVWEGIIGSPPDLINIPKGCAFSPRCKLCKPECLEAAPLFTEISDDHFVRCHLFRK